MRAQMRRLAGDAGTAAPLIIMITGIVILVWSLTSAGSILRSFERKTVDIRFRMRGPVETTDRMAIVQVDDRSLGDEQLGSWPWPRKHFAKLVDYLTAAGARAIVFDIFFRRPHPQYPQSDTQFRAAIARSGRVYLAGTTIYDTSGGGQDSNGTDAEDTCVLEDARIIEGNGLDMFATLPIARRLVLPLAEFAHAARGIGIVDIPADEDGATRDYLPVFVKDGRPCPSLALAVVSDVLSVPSERMVIHTGNWIELGGKRRIPLTRSGAMPINFAGGQQQFDRYSAVDVIQKADTIKPKTFDDKIVLVAVTAGGLHDVHPTPFSGAAKGINVHANAIHTMLTGDFLYQQFPESALLVTLACLIIIALLAARARPVIYVIGSISFIVLYNVAAIMLFNVRGLIIDMFVPTTAMGAAVLAATLYMLVSEHGRQHALADVLGRFVPPEIAGQLTSDRAEIAVSGERRVITVLFADLREFTAASARMGAEQTVLLLNRYFELMHEIVFEFDGTLDKFIGDEIMAFFNAPAVQPDHATIAVACALKMQQSIEAYRDEWKFHGMPDLQAGVGISTGKAVIGCIGSGARMQYTAIGEDVNLASRLQALSKEVQENVVISEGTYELVKDAFECRDLGTRHLQGIEDAVRVYAVVDTKEDAGGATASNSAQPKDR